MVSMKKILKFFSHYKSMGANDSRSVASFDPRVLIGWIYIGDHKPLPQTKYISYGPRGFREEHFSPLWAVYGRYLWTWRPSWFTDSNYLHKCYGPFNTRLHMKFEEISSKGFRGEVVRMCKRTYLRRTMDNGRRTGSDQNSSIFHSGELKSERLGILSVIFSSCRPVSKRALTEVISLFHFVSFANETNATDH